MTTLSTEDTIFVVPILAERSVNIFSPGNVLFPTLRERPAVGTPEAQFSSKWVRRSGRYENLKPSILGVNASSRALMRLFQALTKCPWAQQGSADAKELSIRVSEWNSVIGNGLRSILEQYLDDAELPFNVFVV